MCGMVDFYGAIGKYDRFAMFCFEGNCISIMNGHFDSDRNIIEVTGDYIPKNGEFEE